MWSVSNWWHDGEEPGSVVYRHTCWPALWLAGGVTIGMYVFPPLRDPVVAAVFSLGVLRLLLERRRAIILDDGKVGVRPALAKAFFVPFAQISTIEPAPVARVLFFKPIYTGGLRLSRPNRQPVYLPLDFPKRDEIRARLDAAVRLPPADGRGEAPPRLTP